MFFFPAHGWQEALQEKVQTDQDQQDNQQTTKKTPKAKQPKNKATNKTKKDNKNTTERTTKTGQKGIKHKRRSGVETTSESGKNFYLMYWCRGAEATTRQTTPPKHNKEKATRPTTPWTGAIITKGIIVARRDKVKDRASGFSWVRADMTNLVTSGIKWLSDRVNHRFPCTIANSMDTKQ